jgi:hypothetical protein
MQREDIEHPGFLSQRFSYNADTGLVSRLCHGPAGAVGRMKDGYLRIMVARTYVYVHRIAWILHSGKPIPPGQYIDHINRNKSDNRIENLRLVSHKQNCQNRGLNKNNTVGFAGVSRCRDKFRAIIKRDGKPVSLGVFTTPELAHLAYCQARDAAFPASGSYTAEAGSTTDAH